MFCKIVFGLALFTTPFVHGKLDLLFVINVILVYSASIRALGLVIFIRFLADCTYPRLILCAKVSTSEAKFMSFVNSIACTTCPALFLRFRVMGNDLFQQGLP